MVERSGSLAMGPPALIREVRRMEAIFFLAVWVAIGYWTARIMEKKGRSAGAGWALGLVLGLLGTLIAALLTPDHTTLLKQERERRRLLGMSDEEFERQIEAGDV
jgi:hypothetical protein